MHFLNEYKGLGRNNYILFIGKMMTSFGSMVFSMITLILSQKLGVKATEIAVLMFLVGIISMPVGMIGGKLADRCSKKKVIIICDIVSIVSCFYAAIVPLSMTSIVVFALGSLFQSMEYPSYTALIAEVTPSSKRQQAYSLNYLGMNLGMVLSPTIAGFLFKDYLWLMFVLQAVCIGFSTILIAVFLNESLTYESSSQYEEAKDNHSLKEVMKANPLIVFFALVNAVYFAVYSEYQYLLPLDMGSVHGNNGALIYGTVSSINCIVVVLFTPLITKWFAKMSDIIKVETGSILVVLGFVMYIVLRGYVPAYYLVMTVFTWGEIFATISMDAYVTARTPSSHLGRIIAFENVVQALMMGIYEMLVGNAYDHLGSSLTWAIVIGTGIMAVVMYDSIRRKDHRVYSNLYEKQGD